MKLKTLTFAIAIAVVTLFSCDCHAQSNPCGAASFTLYGNYQNQQVQFYFIGIDENAYNNLVNNYQGNYGLQAAQAAYLSSAILNSNVPVASVVAQIVINSNGVAQNGPSTFITPSSPQFQSILQEALIWSYMQNWYSNMNQQSEMSLEQSDFQQIYQGEWLQQAGYTAAYWVNAATVSGQLAEYLPLLMGDDDAATQVGDAVSLFQDINEGFPDLQSVFGGNASNIVSVLKKYNVVVDQNYTSAQIVVGIGNLDPSQLSQFETDLYAAAYPSVTLKPNAQPVIANFLENAGAGAKDLGISASAAGAVAFYQAYGVYELSAGTSAEIALSEAGSYFTDGLTPLAAASLITTSYTTPQADILKDMVYCQNILSTNLFPEFNSVSSKMTDIHGTPNFDTGVDFAAELQIISSFESLWCTLGADEESNQVIQSQLQQYVTLGPAFIGRAAEMYSAISTAGLISSNLANQSTAISAPVISGLGETHGALGDEFTISGANFCNAVAVYFSNSPAWFQVNSSTSITTVAPAGADTVDIRVVGPGGVSQINANDKFTYGTTSPSPTNKVISLTGNLAFGNVTVETSAQRTLTIGNTGNTNLTVNSIIYTNANGFSGNWTGIIPPGASTNLAVTFSPTLTTSYGGNVTVNSDANGGINVISASGTGVAASSGPTAIIELIPWSDTDFGDVQVNSSATRVVAIYNAGNEVLHVFSINYPTGFNGNCNSAYITPGSEAIDTITFTPAVPLPYGGNMTITTDATSGATNLNLSGSGVSPQPPSTNEIPVGAFETLHSFDDYDGNNPYAPLVLGSDGGFYGTTYRGGTNPSGNLSGVGTIFRIASDGSFLSLYSFQQGNAYTNGQLPMAGLVQGTDGNFYGATTSGGWGAGTVFSITSSGSFNLLATFYDTNGDAPFGGLIQGGDGNFYGTTETGGTIPSGNGTIFRMTPTGILTILYDFTNGTDGALPYSSLLAASDGSFYGTTPFAGIWRNGTVYKITPAGNFTVLCSFDGTNGSTPLDGLVEGNDGNFYGTTTGGGASGNGTIFQMASNGTLTSLYSFTGGNDGSRPQGSLIQAADGNFYGTASAGGSSGYGTIFRISTNGNFAVLHQFLGGNEGRKPLAGVIIGPDGNLYGTTENGGNNDQGTVFRLVIPPTVQPLTVIGNKITLSWNLVPDQTYQVQYTSDLASGNWSNLTAQLTPSFNTLTISDFISATNQQRYYRIVEFPEAW